MPKISNHQLIIRACTSLASATLCATIFLTINTNNAKASAMSLPVQSNVEKNVNQTNYLINNKSKLKGRRISGGSSWSYSYVDNGELIIGDTEIKDPISIYASFHLVANQITKITFLKPITFSGDLSEVFSNLPNLTTIQFNGVDTKQVTNMSHMFANDTSLTDIKADLLDTENVTDMSYMFSECSSLTNKLDVSDFDTHNVTDMSAMFADCSALTKLDVSKWDVSNTSDTDFMFFNCSSLTKLDVSQWHTKQLHSTHGMFSGCEKLGEIDVSNWTTDILETAERMFENCRSLTKLDLSNFDDEIMKVGSKVNYSNMLKGLDNLQQLKVGKTLNLKYTNFDTPTTWVSVGTGTIKHPVGTEYYSSDDLAKFWNDKDYTETWVRNVKYNVNVNYVDLDDNNKIIKTDSISSNNLQPIDYKSSFDKIVAGLKDKHYEYAAGDDKLPWSNGQIQLPDDVTDNATYTVGFKHATSNVKDGDKNPVTGDKIDGLSKTVTQTIKYTGAPTDISDNVQKVTFKRDADVDMVTGKLTYHNWDNKELLFKDVASPIVTGYDANPSSVKGATVTPDSSDITKAVTYVRSNYGIKINYVDGDDNNTILKTDTIEGNPEKVIAYKDKMTSIINSLTGYLLNKAKTDLPLNENGDIKLPPDVLGSKTYNVVLSHKTVAMKPGDKNPVTGKNEDGLTKVVTRIIKYTGAPNSINDKVQKVTFMRNATVDLVTGKLTYLDWDKDSQTLAEVVSPKVEGYTANPETVKAQSVKPTDSDITKEVKYSRGSYNIKIDYVDSNTGKVVKTDKVSGNPDKIISYQDQLKEILHDLPSYVIDKDKTTLPLDDNNDIKLPADVTDDKDYQVVLKHDSKTMHAGDKNPVTGKDEDSLIKTITQTIKYTGAPSPITDNVQKVTFERDADVDMVTGKLTYHDWNKESQTFADITSPVVDGYDADIAVVKGTTVKPTDSDITKTVTYTKKEAPSYDITINYQDDTGTVVNTDKQKGKAGTIIQYHDKLQEIINQIGNGKYEIDKDKSNLPLDNNNDIKLPDDLATDHDYHVVLKHKIVTIKSGDKNPVTGELVSGLTKEVKQIVKYTGANKDISDNTQTVKFTRNGQVDLATGKLTYLEWNEKVQSFKDVVSPIVSDYTPDIAVVKGIAVTADSTDIVKQVTYTKDKQDNTSKDDPEYEIAIDYQDETGKTIKTDKQKGKANSTIPYKNRMQEIINSIAKNGYEVDWSKSNLPVDSNGNIKLGVITGDTNYKLVLKHKMVTFKYGEKNPFTGQEDPNLEHKVTQTIKYLNSKQNLSNSVQTLTFTRDAQVDMITGKVTYLDWHEDKQTFKDVKSPFVKGYVADLPVVKGRTVTGNSKNIVQLVTYNKSKVVQTGLNLTRNEQSTILGTIIAAFAGILSYFGILKKKDKKD